ncbi:DUF2627 domain-containing protein [Paenactinomyces guangxiensis]|uniref:DUF2627 domain-containing protein n=2 Tax=Paenactinomyces guangxiensis TaxID=1490290 RepID=A0A7W2A7Y4_9BACL|nr:DUF2627 domain-containing protein [Paenactinomyces guangxiensis]MBA4495016.1 DUF2627 domain-containing protein [Paenactinomyces guangxiensis]MBH8592099.1 DUF2627 domain-containing protein [Paenactinomyces guangxiensis]
MKIIYQRIFAIIIMCIPGILAIYGWTVMRDILFDYLAGQGFALLSFLGALVLFLLGLSIIGGFIFHRDKKRNKIQPRLLGKKEDPDKVRKPGF